MTVFGKGLDVLSCVLVCKGMGTRYALLRIFREMSGVGWCQGIYGIQVRGSTEQGAVLSGLAL